MNQRNQARNQAARRNQAPRLRILPYGPSDSVNALCTRLGEMGTPALKLSLTNSAFRGRDGDLIINWGNGSIADATFRAIAGQGKVLNMPSAIRIASHKVRAFEAMDHEGVKQVEFTTNSNVAQEWLDAGGVVYARTRVQGHSGEGIVVCTTQDLPDLGGLESSRTLVRAPLYTKGITVQRREFRIHVMNGEIVYVQQKKRTNDYRDNPNYSNVVRNYHTGWIYATENVQVNAAGQAEAVKAVTALGLDFGAVDVITRGNDAWVLEVNTAPGLQGTNLDNYATAILAAFRGEEFAPVQQVEGGLDELVAAAEEMQRAPQAVNIQAMAAEVAARVDEVREQAAERVERHRIALEAERVERHRAIAEAAMRAAGDVQREEPMIVAAFDEPIGLAVPNNQIFNGNINLVPPMVDKAFYSIRVEGQDENTVGQFNAAQNMFYIVGWDVPVAKDDVTVNAMLIV